MDLSDGNLLAQVLCRIPYCIWVYIERLAKLVLVLLFLSLPVALASFEEMETAHDVHPRPDCIGLVAADNGAVWHRMACFGGDFLADWGDKFVIFLTLVAVDCEPVTDRQANQECNDRRSRRIKNLLKHSVVLLSGIVLAF